MKVNIVDDAVNKSDMRAGRNGLYDSLYRLWKHLWTAIHYSRPTYVRHWPRWALV